MALLGRLNTMTDIHFYGLSILGSDFHESNCAFDKRYSVILDEAWFSEVLLPTCGVAIADVHFLRYIQLDWFLKTGDVEFHPLAGLNTEVQHLRCDIRRADVPSKRIVFKLYRLKKNIVKFHVTKFFG